MSKKNIFVPIVLGMLTAFGPFVTDFYLSTLPEMGQYYDTTESMVQLSLTMGMIGLALGQVLIGPLTDKLGRKRILVVSMFLFAISDGLCIFAPNIFVFNIMRLFQGIAGAGGIVISRSMATDMYKGKALADFMAVLQAINGIAPILAPVIGGGVASVSSWKGVFTVLLAIGIILMVCSMRLKETLTPENRVKKRLGAVYANLYRSFRSPVFTLCVLINMAYAFPFFGYISSSPFILQEGYGLSPLAYSLCFGLNAIMIGVGAGLSVRFRDQMRCLKAGAVNYVAGTMCVAVCLVFHLSVWLLMAAYVYMVFGFGMMQSPTLAFALDSQREHAGAASAVFGASLFLAGGVASPLVGIGNINYATSIVSVGGALACLVFALMLSSYFKRTERLRTSL